MGLLLGGVVVKVDRIVTRHMDWGVGVLRGIRSHGALAHLAPSEVEAAIEHIRGAARIVERIQRERWQAAHPRLRRSRSRR